MINYFEDSTIELVIGFDRNGMVRVVETRDGLRTIDVEGEPPVDTFRGGPIRNINLIKIEELSIMVFEQLDENRNVIKRFVCPHANCRPCCRD